MQGSSHLPYLFVLMAVPEDQPVDRWELVGCPYPEYEQEILSIEQTFPKIVEETAAEGFVKSAEMPQAGIMERPPQLQDVFVRGLKDFFRMSCVLVVILNMCSLILGAGTVIDATAFDLLRYTGRGLGLNKHTRLILVMLACVAYVMVQSFAIWARAQGMLALERRSFLGRRVVKVYQGIRAVFKVFSVLVLMISICLTMLAVGTAGMSAAFSLLLYMNQRQRYYAKLVLGALLCVGYVLVMFATLLAAHLIIPAFLVLAFDLACRLLTVFCRCLKVCFHLCGVFVLLQSISSVFQVLGAESISTTDVSGNYTILTVSLLACVVYVLLQKPPGTRRSKFYR